AAEQALILQPGALLGAYALPRAPRGRRLALVAAVVVASVLVGAGMLVPALDFLRDSGRDAPMPYTSAAQWSFPPARLLELAFPTLFASYGRETYVWSQTRFHPTTSMPWLFSVYFGLLGFVLAVTGFVRRLRGAGFTAAIGVAG